MQDALEPLIMLAAPVSIHLRIKGFAEQVLSDALTTCTSTVTIRGMRQQCMSCFANFRVGEHALEKYDGQIALG